MIVAWMVEYKDAARRRWTLFKGLWWGKKEAVQFSRQWWESLGNGGLTGVRVVRVLIERGRVYPVAGEGKE